MVVGSLSVNLYAEPRSSQDAGFVVQFSSGSLKKLLAELPPGFRVDPQVKFETITGTTRTELHLDEIAYRIELFDLSNDAHDQECFKRRVQKLIGDVAVWAPTPEDVIVMKVRWCKDGKRGKDIGDVQSLIAIMHKTLDWDYIHHWADIHGTRETLDQIRDSIPPLDWWGRFRLKGSSCNLV